MCGRVVQKTPLSQIRVLFETVVPNAAPNWPVGKRVGNVKNNDPSLVEPIASGDA